MYSGRVFAIMGVLVVVIEWLMEWIREMWEVLSAVP